MLGSFDSPPIQPMEADKPPSYQGQERLLSSESHHGLVMATPSWGQHQWGYP